MKDFSGFFKYMVGKRGLKEKSVIMYINRLKWMQKRLDKDIENFTSEDVETLFAHYPDTLRHNSKVLDNVVIKQFFRYWKKTKKLLTTPVDDLESFKKEIIEPRVLKVQEIVALIKACDMRFKDFKDLKYAAIICMFADTGMRVSELINLRVGHIEELEDNFIVSIVHPTKNYKQRRVPFAALSSGNIVGEIWSFYWQTIKHIKKWEADNYLFPNKDGMKYTQTSLAQIFKRLGAKAEVEFTFHSFRHFYATHLVKNGADIILVKERLGHKNIDSTMRYIHMADLLRKESLKKNPLHSYKTDFRGFVKNQKKIVGVKIGSDKFRVED